MDSLITTKIIVKTSDLILVYAEKHYNDFKQNETSNKITNNILNNVYYSIIKLKRNIKKGEPKITIEFIIGTRIERIPEIEFKINKFKWNKIERIINSDIQMYLQLKNYER